MKKENKIVKFLKVLKKTWYFLLFCVIVFGFIGFFIGKKQSQHPGLIISKDYVVLKTNIIICDGNYQNFSDSFNNSCYYFMNSKDILKDTLSECNYEVSEKELNGIVSINQMQNVTNMFEVNVKLSTKEETKILFDKYIKKLSVYLNKTFRNNIDENGVFISGTKEESKILISQVGDIAYSVYTQAPVREKISITLYTLFGSLVGLIGAIFAVFFVKFYFIIQTPEDVSKNFQIKFMKNFEDEEQITSFLNEQQKVFCISGKNKRLNSENCYTIDEIIKNNEICGEIIIVVQEEKDTYFFIEKVQQVFMNDIVGFIIYK